LWLGVLREFHASRTILSSCDELRLGLAAITGEVDTMGRGRGRGTCAWAARVAGFRAGAA
jgi:hypothetical protein